MTNTSGGKVYRVGLVGAGYVSSYHLLALRSLPNVAVVGIADSDQSRAAQTASQFGISGVFRSLNEMSETRPDVIHVLTPPASHCSLTLEALDMGCHVFVEKPMALSEEECEQMIAKAAARERTLSVNHSARFDPAVLRAFDVIRAGTIGDVLTVDYFRSSEYPPYSGGMMPPYYRDAGYPFRDLGVHALYILESFLGEIKNVNAWYQATGRHTHLMFDEWRAHVECQKGYGQVHLSWNSRPMQNTILVQGTKGALCIDSFLETCKIVRSLPGPKAASLIWNAVYGSASHAANALWNAAKFAAGRIGPSPDIQRSVCEFYRSLSAASAPPVSAEEGKRAVIWVEKIARQADAEKKRLNAARPVPKPASILVTGGSGFLGRALVKALLASGETVRLLARQQAPVAFRNHPCVDVMQGDLGDPESVDWAVQGVDTVYHVGAATNGSAEDYQCGTIAGTRNVVDASLRHGVKKLIYVSSLSVLDYAGLRQGAHVDESAALEPSPEKRGLYTHSKLQAERIVLDGVNRGLHAVILRPGQIFGPGTEHVPPYGTISIGSFWVVMGNGGTELPLVYVDDVVDALLRSGSRSDAEGQIVQLVDPEIVNQREYVKLCRQKLPGLHVAYVPLPVLYCAAIGLEMLGRLMRRNVPLTIYRLKSLKARLRFDCRAAQEKLGWTPQTGVREGLRRTFQVGYGPAVKA